MKRPTPLPNIDRRLFTAERRGASFLQLIGVLGGSVLIAWLAAQWWN